MTTIFSVLVTGQYLSGKTTFIRQVSNMDIIGKITPNRDFNGGY
jgi:signal recognition particle receptor subunit beta